MTYLGEKKLANFRNREPKEHKNSEAYKQRPGMSDKHLALIRRLPCCVCGKSYAGEAHHLKSGIGERGMGIRTTDRWTVPMCHNDHMEVERAGSKRETEWFKKRGVFPTLLALDLWTNTGDEARMRRVLAAHKEVAS